MFEISLDSMEKVCFISLGDFKDFLQYFDFA